MKSQCEVGEDGDVSDSSSDPDLITNLLEQAYKYYSAGQLDKTEELLRKILIVDPDNPEAVKLLGAILFTTRGPEVASAYIERAVELLPNDPDCYNNLGTLSWAQGRLTEAARHFQNAISLAPEHARAQFNLGNVLRNLGKLTDSAQAYRKALENEPDSAEIHDSLGTLLLAQGQITDAINAHQKAVELNSQQGTFYANLANALSMAGLRPAAIQACKKAVEQDPKRAEFYLNLGGLLQKEGRLDEAAAAFGKALKLRPDLGMVYNNLGAVLREQGRPEDALASFQAASELASDSPGVWSNLGSTLHDLMHFQEAAEAFKQALQLKPDWGEAAVNLGNAFYKQDKIEEALGAFDQAIELNDKIVEAHRHRALVMQKLGRWKESLEGYNKAVALRPDDPQSLAGRGMILLKLGDFDRGLRDYEWRFEAMGFDYLPESAYRTPSWEGEPFVGKTLLIYHEQGLGDALQLTCYMKMVKARGGKVVVLCGPPLMRLLESQPYVDEVLSRREEQQIDFDYHVALMSLPRIFAATLDTIPSQVPYLDIDPQLVDSWGKRIEKNNKFKVGLVWSGNPDQGDDKDRSCRLSDFAPLSKIPGVDFYSLQLGAAASQTENLPDGMQLIDFTKDLHDFLETAALIRNLDLVITVDTSVAHLAGTMGHPVWTVLWFNHCWRYLLDREDSPWYPTMRLFRQPALGDWNSVFKKVAESLAVQVEDHSAQRQQPG